MLTNNQPERSTDIQTFDKPVQFLAGVITQPQRFVAGATTPTVEAHNVWIANSIAPVTITNFLKGAFGQNIYILGDGFTTIANNANIKTNTGANKLLATNMFYMFTFFNGVWYEIASSGATDPWTVVKLGSNFDTLSTTQVSVTGLNFTPAANTTYIFELFLLVRTPSPAPATTGARVGLNWPSAGITHMGAHIMAPTSATALVDRFWGSNAAGNAASTTDQPDNSNAWFVNGRGSIVMGASPSGTVQVTLSSEVGTDTVRMCAGSALLYRAI